ncbi:MAG: MFS transporter [Dehalococcoidales bacterium]
MNKIFFGWYVVAAAVVLVTYQSLMFIFGFTAFMSPIAATFGWTMAQVAFASSLRGLETGTLDPFLGMAADRWPARRLIVTGLFILALGTFIISQATGLIMFYAGFLVVGLGSGLSVYMVPTTVIARWFRKNIGKASGVLAMGFALGGLFVPLLTMAIDTYGWQDTLVYLSVGILIIGLPLVAFFRNSPEEYGLLPDGEVTGDAEKPGLDDSDIGVKEALKTRVFWFLGLSSMFQMAAMLAVNIHLMPYLTSLGIARSVAALAVTIYSFATLTARIPFGVMADIFTKKYVMAVSLGLTTVGLVLYGMIDGSSFAMVVLFTVVYGLGTAGAMPLRAAIIREYFGARKFGTIYGIVSVFTTVGSAIGAPLAGWVFDSSGQYDPIWYIFAALVALGTVLILIIPHSPGHRDNAGERV